MIWNDFGSKFYIWGGANRLISTLIVPINPWFMPIMFVIAGIGARYSLEKRSDKEFVRERVKKLLLPFACGMVFLVPIQTLFARRFFHGYAGGFFDNLQYFYTHFSDMSGYDGAFTPGHLWFILFLFVISLLALAVKRFLPYEMVGNHVSKMRVWMIIGLFVPVWLMYYLGNFGGFSIGKCFALYLMGYYVLSNEEILCKLDNILKWIVLLFAASTSILIYAYFQWSYYGDLLVNFAGWMGILAFIVLAKKYLDQKTAFTTYFNSASFPIYILHQSILVALAYYVLPAVNGLIFQISIIAIGSFGATLLSYHLLKNIPFVRNMLGIYKKNGIQ
jgi:hypothetical protein